MSSFLGYTSFAGYSPYSPGKYALRGLADSLRSELQLHDITVHLYMPAGILSPGYENEQKTKPGITKQIEEGDTPIAPEAAAALLIKGLERGNYQITNDLVTDLVRVASKGPVPGNGLVDLVYGFIGSVRGRGGGGVGRNGKVLTAADWPAYLARRRRLQDP